MVKKDKAHKGKLDKVSNDVEKQTNKKRKKARNKLVIFCGE